jgi:hypothetical protein
MLYLLSYGHHAQDDSTSERTPGKASFVPGFVIYRVGVNVGATARGSYAGAGRGFPLPAFAGTGSAGMTGEERVGRSHGVCGF